MSYHSLKENDEAVSVAEQAIQDIPTAAKKEKIYFEGVISTLFKHLNLNDKDVIIICQFLNALFDGSYSIKATDILRNLSDDRAIALSELKRLARLTRLGILQVSSQGNKDSGGDGVILRSTLQLSDDVLNSLCEDSEVMRLCEPSLPKPYSDNLEFLADQFKKIDAMGSADITERFIQKSEEGLSESKKREKKIQRCDGDIQLRLGLTEFKFPLEKFKKQKNLSKDEEIIVIALLQNTMLNRNGWRRHELVDLISGSPRDRLANIGLFAKDCRLVKEGIVEFTESETRSGRKVTNVQLCEKLRRLLIGENKKRHKGETYDNLFEITKPSVSLNDVILPPKTLASITVAINMMQGHGRSNLHKWGFKHNLMAPPGKGQSVTMLFYGPPGTGKTLAAHSIAHQLKKSILGLDCSKIFGRFVGDSEKNTRGMFDKYRTLIKHTKNYPILLLNEADQFLQKRIDVNSSVDAMYNKVQNIILEQMESFTGILIATTNLIDHLDPALSRRFHHKVEFERPGFEERLRLWRVHIPAKAPLSSDVDINDLATSYSFSGGQIALAIRNAAAEAAIRGDRITQADIINACEKESAATFEGKTKVKIGFVSSSCTGMKNPTIEGSDR